jgi:hypothetical protein
MATSPVSFVCKRCESASAARAADQILSSKEIAANEIVSLLHRGRFVIESPPTFQHAFVRWLVRDCDRTFRDVSDSLQQFLSGPHQRTSTLVRWSPGLSIPRGYLGPLGTLCAGTSADAKAKE